MITIQTTKPYPGKAINPYIALARPKHWLKNSLVFVPLLYAHNLADVRLLLATIQCFAAFCLISSAVYVVNDIFDVEKDRQHPVKNKRPIACGDVSFKQALGFAAFLCLTGFALAALGYNNYNVALFAVLYVLLNLAYSFGLKNIAVVDCFCIAAGFVFRIYAGGAASVDTITEWLFLTMMAVSLFMAFGKRLGEIMRVNDTAMTRKVLASYDSQFLNGMMFVFAGLSVVFYALWALSSVYNMIYTVPLVVFIICKYLLIIYNKDSLGDPTTIILGDKGLMLASVFFGLLSVVLLYL